jgi:hypothetical protein
MGRDSSRIGGGQLQDRAVIKTLLLVLLLAFIITLAVPALLLAEERSCRSEIGGVTVDNVRVPDGANCVLNRTRVKGNIRVGSRAMLNARGVRVGGNVQAENARQVSVTESSRVGGSVQIKQGGGATVLNSTVQGDIQFDDNRSPLRTNDNKVGGNVQIVGNQAHVEVFRNSIDGNLQCKENSPRPSGGANRVRGNKEDQCARFSVVFSKFVT